MTDNMVGDRYVIGPLLGRGGMAEVRRARDTRLERDVAIKRLKPDLAGDPIFQERFRREAHSAAGLNHPNIVSVYDTGESFDEASGLMIPYIVMELVVGHTLREILHDGRKIQPVKALELTQCVLDALDYSHRHGIIHRDIKPANVMLTNSGQVKVMDFGIARAVSDTAASMTQTASVIGTPQYLSPEQIRGETVDRRSDLYSTGCLLYELLTGKPPFEGDSPVSLAYQHVRATPVPPSEVDPMVSTQMDKVTLKALAKNPTDRYQTAHEMFEDISRLLAGQKVAAVVPPSVEDTPTQVLDMEDATKVMPPGSGDGKPPAKGLDADEEQPSHLGRIIAIVLGVMLIIALGAVGLVWALNKGGDPPPSDPSTGCILVPKVVTMSEQGAIDTLGAKGLGYRVVNEYGPDDSTIGTVIEQSPPEGSCVFPKSSVAIKVNRGPETFPVPNVIGEHQDKAKAIMEETFTNVVLEPAKEEGPNAVPYTILSSSPAPGGRAAKDQQITLYYATGQVKVPDVIGMSLESAYLRLGQAGFGPSSVKTVNQESDKLPGIVVAMQPPPLEVVAKDTEIILYIAVPYPTTSAPPTTTSTPTDPSSTPT